MTKKSQSERRNMKKKARDNEPVTEEDLLTVQEELRQKFEEEFEMDGLGDIFTTFTEEAKVEQYARWLWFLEKHTPVTVPTDDLTSLSFARCIFIENMKTGLNNGAKEKFKDQPQLYKKMKDRIKFLREEYMIELKIKQFMKDNTYPSYEFVRDLLKDERDPLYRCQLLAEYGEYNHELLGSLWEDFFEKDFIKTIGIRIGSRGGFQAMQSNVGAVMIVTRYFLRKSSLHLSDAKGSDNLSNEIQSFIYHELNSKWNGIQGWLA